MFAFIYFFYVCFWCFRAQTKQWCIVWCDGMEMHIVQFTIFSLILSCSCHHFNIYCFRELVKQWLLLVDAGKCRLTCSHRNVVETKTKCIEIASKMSVYCEHFAYSRQLSHTLEYNGRNFRDVRAYQLKSSSLRGRHHVHFRFTFNGAFNFIYLPFDPIYIRQRLRRLRCSLAFNVSVCCGDRRPWANARWEHLFSSA